MLLFCACPRRTKYVYKAPEPQQRYIYVETTFLTDKIPNANREITETNKFKSIAPKVTKYMTA